MFNTKNHSFLKISQIILVLGILLLLSGLGLYLDYTYTGSSEIPRGSSGFSFSSNPFHEHQMGDLRFWIDIDAENNAMWIWTSFVSYEEGQYYVVIFTPYIISSLEEGYVNPVNTSVSWDFKNANEGSIIFANFSITENTTQGQDAKVKLIVNNPIVLRNFGSYTLDIPFASPPSEDVQKLLDEIPVNIPGNNEDFPVLLHVTIPSTSVLVRETENINERRFYEDRQLIEFNIEELNPFILTYDVPEEKNAYQQKLFLSGIVIGAGISLIFSETALKEIRNTIIKLKEFLNKRGNGRMHLRPYQGFIILGFLAILTYFLSFLPEPSGLYRPDNWASISISLGASILTLVGIIATIVTSNENNRRAELDGVLSNIEKRAITKRDNTHDKKLIQIYEDSIKKIRKMKESIVLIKYQESAIGIISFFFFLASSFYAIIGSPFFFVLGFFLFGMLFLIGYIIYIVEEFSIIDKSSFPEKNTCTLSLLEVQINNQNREFKTLNKKISISINEKIKTIKFKVRLTGTVKNGFLHAIAKYAKPNEFFESHIPDRNTNLMNFGFITNYQLILMPQEKQFDTGILQLKGSIELDFDVVLRSEKNSTENPKVTDLPVMPFGTIPVYNYCSVTEGFVVDSIELRLYEDPYFKPDYKRVEKDCLTVIINRPTQQ